MSTTYIASIVAILAVLLPKFGVQVGSEELTTTLQTLFVIVSALWTIKEKVRKGEINWLGKRA